MKASFDPNVSSLKSTSDIYYSDADIEDFSGIMLTSAESKDITSKINLCKSLLKKSGKVIDIIAKEYGDDIKIFMNTLVRQGSTKGSVDVFIKHMSDRFDKEINKASDRIKPKREAKKNEFMKKVGSKTSALKAAFELSSALTGAKMPLIRKLETIKSMGTFIKTDNGYRITAPEGFVAVDLDGKALKLVDRLEFSRANFTVSKNWDKT